MAIFICSQGFCHRSAKRKSQRKYFSYFVLIWPGATFYLLDHGDIFYTYNRTKKSLRFFISQEKEGKLSGDIVFLYRKSVHNPKKNPRIYSTRAQYIQMFYPIFNKVSLKFKYSIMVLNVIYQFY